MSSVAPQSAPPLEAVKKIGQKCLEETPVIILGSGASIACGIRGMAELARHLTDSIQPQEPGDTTAWEAFKAELLACNDLELALQKVQLSPNMLSQVVKETRNAILSDDLQVLERLVSRQADLALSHLFRHLFQSTNPSISVVTTNYDRLAEYAADLAKFAWNTGFIGGHLRSFGGDSSTSPKTRTVNIWKVHGSLHWFKDTDEVPVALPDHLAATNSLAPLLVTPGITKYETTHYDPFRTIIQKADGALTAARAVLCVGYGFNDGHIQPKFVERVRDHAIPVVILAKELTSAAKAFLPKLVKCPYLALEENGSGTRAYFPDAPDGIDIPDQGLWRFESFLNVTIGSC